MATMFEQTVGSSVPPQYVGNDMSLGIGWFKYGSLPDAKFYMWLPNDNLSIDGCTYQVSPDQILIPGLPGPHVNNVENTTSLNPQISSVYTWYKNGVVQTGFTTYNPFLPVTHTGIPETWTCEMIVDDPGNSGWFHQYKYRDDIVLKGSIPTVSISAASLNICPNDFITFDANPLNPGITPTYQWTSSVRGPVGSNSSTLTLGSFTNNETITVTMTIAGTCSITVANTVTVTLITVTTPQITNLNNNYCSSDATVNLIGNPTGGTFLVNGISTNQFNPAIFGGTSIDVTYTMSTPCTTSVTTNVTVSNVPNVSVITPIEVCENSGMLNLNVGANPNPAGGAFLGTWVTSPDFDVSSAGTGTHSVNYSYTDLTTLCSNTASLNIEVTPNVNPTVTIFPNTSASIFIGDPVTLSYSISPAPVCTNFIVEVWWRHEPQGAATEHFYTTIPCQPCTLDIVPTSLLDGGDQFITGDELFLRYRPCDCAAATQYDSDNLIVEIINDGCDANNYIKVIDIVPATCPSLNNGGFKATMPYPVNTYKLFSGSTWLQTITASLSGSDWYALFANLPAGIYTVKAYDALDQLISFTETCDNGSPFTYHLETSLYINGINNLPFPIVTTNTNLNCGSSLSCGSFSTYQWYLNNVLLTDVNANSAVYPISLDGNYKVFVTNSNGCGSLSSVVNVSNHFTATISGPTTNCTTNVYSVTANGNNSTYTWTVPPGATFTQTGNSITVNWGIAYGTGGQITCKVVDACGNQSLALYTVSPCCNMTATLNVHSTCNGSTSNGSISSSVINNVGPITYIWNPNVSVSSSLSHLSPGNYTLVATDSRGCTASVTGQVLSSSLLTVSMNPSPACTPSNNGSIVSIPSGGVGPYTYWWNNLSNGYSITNVAAGTYTVTVTDLRGCTMTNSAVVNSIAGNFTKPIVSGPSSACQSSGTSLYTILNYQTNYNNLYNWYVVPNSGSYNITYPSNNKKIASITWSNTGGGKIIIRLGTSVCLITDTIFVEGCCQNTYTYYDGDFPDDVINSSSVTRANMTFNGNFIINRDFSFLNCGQVSFAPGAKITVRGGTTITIDNCNLTSSSNCCRMWKGIVLEPGAHIVLRNGAFISEAEFGLLVNDKSTYNISNSHFRNNYIGIKIGTGTPVDITGSYISATDFYSDPYTCGGTTYTPFVQKYEGQQTNPGSYPLAGIQVDNCSYFKFGKLSNVAGGDIRFYNLANGVIANNSQVYIVNATFKNIIRDSQYDVMLANQNGCGIRATNCYLNFHGLGGNFTSDYTIENANYGFLLMGTDGDISEVNTNSDTRIGTYLANCTKVNLLKNSWQAKYVGVWTYHNPDGEIHISNSSFRMSTTLTSLAGIRNDEFTHGNKVIINNNTFLLNRAKYGIYSNGLVYAEIKQNDIAMNSNYNIGGVYAAYSSKNTYKCNSVYAYQMFATRQFGFRFSLSPSNTIECNYTNRQYYGIRFLGSCSGTYLKGNNFHDHNFGLSLNFNGLIGTQYNAGNSWTGTYTSYGAYLSGINQGSASANQFDYYSSGPSSNNTSTNDIYGYNWFEGDGNSDEFTCANFDCQPTIPREEQLSGEDVIIAQGDNIGNEFTEPSNYIADKFLFEKLKNNPDIMTNNPILQAFYDQELNGSIGLFTELKDDIKTAVQWESVYSIVYSTNRNMIVNYTDTIHDLDSLLEIDPTNQMLHDRISGLNDQVRSIKTSNEQIMDVMKTIEEYNRSNAETANSTIPVSEDYETNEASVNEIYLGTVARQRYNFTTDQQSTLEAIIEQCPFAGGPSVYTALSLYALIDQSIGWDDDAICISYGIAPRHAKPSTENQFSIYPNPASDRISMDYTINKGDKCVITIYNLLGVAVYTTVVDNSSKHLDVDISNLKPALYHFKITVDDFTEKQGSLSVIR